MEPNTKKYEILLIEDNEYDVELTLRALQKQNLADKVIVLRDGEEALNYIFSLGQYLGHKITYDPKLILLDLKLPKINGFEVLSKLRANADTKVIPVVMLTSSNDDRDILHSYDLGVNSYITKPVNSEKFVMAVSEIGLYWMLLNKPPEIHSHKGYLN
jgi:CheY-like chemotaxis protein